MSRRQDEIDARIDVLLSETAAKIEANDLHEVIAVFGTADSPPFAYTAGLSRKGRPELVVFGLPANVAGMMLNAVAAVPHPEAGAPVVVWDELAVRVVPIPEARRREAEANVARALYGEDVDVWQVLWPDAKGVYPGEPGCAYDGVLPLLAEPVAPA